MFVSAEHAAHAQSNRTYFMACPSSNSLNAFLLAPDTRVGRGAAHVRQLTKRLWFHIILIKVFLACVYVLSGFLIYWNRIAVARFLDQFHRIVGSFVN